VFLLIGGAILVGCFVAGQSYRYRSVFFLFVLPGLTALCSMRHSRFTTRLFAITSVCVVFLMWGYFLARPVWAIAASLSGLGVMTAVVKTSFWTGRELIWWWVVSVLLATIMLNVAFSGMVRTVLGHYASSRLGAPGGTKITTVPTRVVS
jgi:hypothetical protein